LAALGFGATRRRQVPADFGRSKGPLASRVRNRNSEHSAAPRPRRFSQEGEGGVLLRLSFYVHSPSTGTQSLTKYSLCKLFVLIFSHLRGISPPHSRPAICIRMLRPRQPWKPSWHHIIDSILASWMVFFDCGWRNQDGIEIGDSRVKPLGSGTRAWS